MFGHIQSFIDIVQISMGVVINFVFENLANYLYLKKELANCLG